MSIATSTVAPAASDSPVQVGRTLLADLLANESMGVTSYEVVKKIEDLTGMSVSDLKSSATSLDRGEAEGIRVEAVERVAYYLGQQDGEEVLSMLQLWNKVGPTSGRFRGLLDYAENVSLTANPAFQSAVASYRKGLTVAFAKGFVKLRHPNDWRRLQAEAGAIRAAGDLLEAETVVSEASRQTADVEEDIDSFALTVSAQAVARETADAVAVEALQEEVVNLATERPGLPAAVILQDARNALRARTLEGPIAQRAYLRAAWVAVPMSEVERKVAEARENALPTWGGVETKRSRALR